ncbi:MAG: hypothetical protein LLG40_00035 [Deltaproteobacteria bacterium]|nr:hypothetical protein [Deltaproteobacteria bacterium]
MENLFDKIKVNLKKGMEEGLAVLKEGANVVSVKMNELSDEGQRQYKMFNLTLKIQDQIKELGGMTYAALDGMKSVDEDKKIKAAYNKIKKLEWQLNKLEGSKKIKTASVPKTAAKTKAQSKKTAKPPVKKTAKKAVKKSAAKK